MATKKIVKFSIFTIIMVIILTTLAGTSLASPVILPDVIENYKYNPEISVDELEFLHKWSGNIEKPSGKVDMPESISIRDSSASFYGHDNLPFFDGMFTDKYQLNTLEFDIIPSDIDLNGIVRTGFWINASISDDNKITGYMVAIGAAELLSIRSGDAATKISLFYVEDLDIGTYNKTIQKAKDDSAGSDIPFILPDNVLELIENYGIAADPAYFLPSGSRLLETYDATDTAFANDSPSMHFRIESSSSSFQVYMTIDGQSEVVLFEKEVSLGTGRGFGFYTQHSNQNCKEMICMRYNNVYIKDVSAKKTFAQVNFKLSGTEISIAESQIKDGLTGGQYKITPPDIEGYRYTGASRESLDALIYEENPDDNITDFYYVAETALDNQAISPRVNNSQFVNPPPKGPDITRLFHLVEGTNINSYVDQDNPNVAIITPDKTNQIGGLWAKEKLDLNKPFKTKMFLHLGHEKDKSGTLADGMTFTMHNDAKGLNAIGGRGEGLGAYTGRVRSGGTDIKDGTYLRNSLCIEFDSFCNRDFDHRVFDPQDSSPDNFSAHCSLVIPRFDYIYPMPEEDGYNGHDNTYFFNPSQEWIEFKVEWKPIFSDKNLGGVLEYTFGGHTETYTVKNVNTIFGGSEVYWGFTGSTGEFSSLQAAAITDLPIQKSSKQVSDKSLAGVDGAAVNVGDEITYNITYFNNTGQIADLTITDKLPVGLEYVKATDSSGGELTGYTKEDRNIFWTIPDVPYGHSGVVTITAKVTEDVGEIVKNQATLEWIYGGSSIKEDLEAENPVNPRKTITINYLNQDGEALKESNTKRVHVDKEYSYIVPVFEGYEFNSWKLNNILQGGKPVTSFIVKNDTEITLIYKMTPVDFSFYKVNMSNTSEKLLGAEFKLYLWEGDGYVPNELIPNDLDESEWSLIDTKTSDGPVIFEKLNPGIYQLVETKAPAGYQLPFGQWRFEINNIGEITILNSVGEIKPPAIQLNTADEIPYLIGNITQYKLPEMGSSGIFWYSFLAVLLLAASVILAAINMLLHRRK